MKAASAPSPVALAVREGSWLLLVATVLTAGSWALRPDRLPLMADPTGYELELAAPLISVTEGLELYDFGDHLFIDTRDGSGDLRPTIPGSFFIRAETFDDDIMEYFDFLTPDTPLILFGDGNLPSVSSIAARLIGRGYTDLLILKGGPEAWAKAGGEISDPGKETP